MEAERSKGTFHDELNELKARHGDVAAGLRVVRFVDESHMSVGAASSDTYTCVELPDGNMECWHSGREE